MIRPNLYHNPQLNVQHEKNCIPSLSISFSLMSKTG